MLEKITLKVKNISDNETPKFACFGDSGFDLRAWVREEDKNSQLDELDNKYFIELKPLERRLIHTGLYFSIPENTEMQVRPRSGCALKQGLSVCNTPGTIDEKYTNEVCIISINLSDKVIKITSGDRIAQGVIMPVYNSRNLQIVTTDNIEDNEYRGKNGFGHSGIK